MFVQICKHRAAEEKRRMDEIEVKNSANKNAGQNRVSIEKLFPSSGSTE